MIKKTFVIFVLLFGVTQSVLADNTETVEIFTTHKNPVVVLSLAGVNTEIYYLDDISRMQNRLNSTIKNTYLSAGKKEVIQNAKDFIVRNHATYLKNIQALNKSALYSIKRLPAIIINGKYKILGTTNVMKALAIYREYINTHDIGNHDEGRA